MKVRSRWYRNVRWLSGSDWLIICEITEPVSKSEGDVLILKNRGQSTLTDQVLGDAAIFINVGEEGKKQMSRNQMSLLNKSARQSFFRTFGYLRV